jgi:hypothetical protein
MAGGIAGAGRAAGHVHAQPHGPVAHAPRRAAEAFGRIPRGTHDWDKFLTPDELRTALERTGMEVVDVTGLGWSPAHGLRLTRDTSLNYLLTAVRRRDAHARLTSGRRPFGRFAEAHDQGSGRLTELARRSYRRGTVRSSRKPPVTCFRRSASGAARMLGVTVVEQAESELL